MRHYINGVNEPYQPSQAVARNYGVGIPVQADYPVIEPVRPLNYFSLLMSRKGTLALFALAGLAFGTALMWPQPYVYRSHAYLEVTGTNENLLNRRELDPMAHPDDNSQVYVNTVARLLQSGPLYNRTAAQLNAGKSWNPPITGREIARNVRVITHDTDRIVEITGDATDPDRAAAIVNGVTSTFIQQDLDSRWQAANTTNSWLTRQLDELATKLRTSEAELEAFTRQKNLLVDGQDGGLADGFARNLQGELTRAQADLAMKEAVYEHTKTSSDVPVDPAYEAYQQQLTTLQKQLAELEATYAPGYYKIPPLKAQIAQLERALKTQRETASTRVENEYRAALRRAELLKSQYDTQLHNATDQTSKMVQYAALKNQVDMNRAVYSEMMQKVKSYGVASAIQASNVHVVDPAVAALLPVRPNKPMTALLISFGFLCVGVFWVLARAGANRTIMEPGESKQYLRAPELGVIPMASQSGIKGLERLENGAMPPLGLGRLRAGVGHGKLETVTWRMSSSLLAESFRSTSASLLLPEQGRDGHRVLVVTSLSPSEGKTTVASNMAIALAGAAGRVLLIDGDRRRARLHTVFGVGNDRGISTLLQQDGASITPEECIVETNIPNLFLLPSGANSLTSSDILYSATMTKLIERFRSEFNVVLIDTPPLLNLADARVLGRVSDGVILVIRSGRVPWESAMAVEQRLYDDGINVLGTILNDWDPKKGGYGAYPYNKSIKSYFAA